MRGLSGTTKLMPDSSYRRPTISRVLRSMNFDQRALRPAAIVLTADAHGDAVAMHRFEHLARRQEHGRGAIVRQHETVAVAMPADGAHDELRHTLAQDVLAAAVANDLARVQELFELGLQALPRRFAVAADARRQVIERERPPRLAQRRQDSGCRGRRLLARCLRARGMPSFSM